MMFNQEINNFKKELETMEEKHKEQEIKRKWSKNIISLDYFLTKEDSEIFLNYLEETDVKQRIRYLYTLKDTYTKHSTLIYRKRKEVYKKIYCIIAKENNLSTDLTKNKKVFFQYLKLPKYKSLYKEIKSIDEKYKKSKTFIINIERLIKIEKKMYKETLNKILPLEEEQLTDYSKILSHDSIATRNLSIFLQDILKDNYIKRYGISLDNFMPEEIDNLFLQISRVKEEEKEEICLLGKDVLKNYLRTISKEEVSKRNFIKKLIALFEENISVEIVEKTDTSSYYTILKLLSEDDRNYPLIKELISKIDNFKYARYQNNHIVFYLLDEMIKNYKLKLVNQGLKFTDPLFYKEVIKLILKENNLTNEEKIKYLEMLSSFETYCQSKKYISMSEISKDIAELSYLNQELPEIEDKTDKLKQQQLILKNVNLHDLTKHYFYTSIEKIFPTENTFTFMIDKIKNYAFSIKYQESGDITLGIHILDNSKLIPLDSEILNHKEYLLRLGTNDLYPTMNLNYTIYPNNKISSLKISPSLLKIDKVIPESDLKKYQTYPFLKDLNKILKIKSKSQSVLLNNSFIIKELIQNILSKEITEIFKSMEVPFIYEEERIDEEKMLKNHNDICQILSKLSKTESYQIINIIKNTKDKYYTMTPTDTSRIILDETTPLGIYLQSTIHKIQEGKYDLSEEIKMISYLLDTLNNEEYTSYQVRNENNKNLKKILKPIN